MTNNEKTEKKSCKKEWSCKSVILTIIIALFLFWFTLSWGINVLKTTMIDDVQTEEVVKLDREVQRQNNVSSNAYEGTAVPTNQVVEKIYFNHYLSDEEWVSMLDTLTYIETPLLPIPICPIYFSSTGNPIIIIENHSTITRSVYNFTAITDISTQTFTNLAQFQKVTDNMIDQYVHLWNTTISNSLNSDYSYNANAYGIDNYSGLPIGYNNELLKNYISITPFELSNNGGSGNMNANPRYDYVYPQYEGELLLYSALDSDIEQNMCLTEILIDTTLTYENYTYTYSSDIYISIEGGIVQYNLDNVYSTQNINDLYLTSYVVANLVYSVYDHGVYINVVYYVNNNTTYNFSDFEDCDVNYDVSYQLGANGVTSTVDTTRTLVQYYSNQSYNNGYNIGNREGYNEGYNVGYEEGKLDDINNKYNYDLGYNVGYHDGSNNEYTKNGFKDIINVIFNAPYNIFNGFLNFEIFGVNLFNLLSFVFTLCLVGFVISLLLKR